MHNKEDERMKTYNKPEIIIEVINCEDVILASFNKAENNEVIVEWGWETDNTL